MNILPILRALARSKVGAILIGLQIALTLAIVCNSLSVIQQFVRSGAIWLRCARCRKWWMPTPGSVFHWTAGAMACR